MKSKALSRKVCIIVLNWNKPKETLACLNSLLPSVQKKMAAIIVCDNASTDNSIKRILTWAKHHFSTISSNQDPPPFISLLQQPTSFSDFVLLQTGKNLGYAGGNNVAIQLALSRKIFEYIFILNNDAVLHPNALEKLVAHADKHQDTGILGSTITYHNQPEIVYCAGGSTYYPLTTLSKNIYQNFSIHQLQSLPTSIKLDYVSGAAAFFRAQLFSDYGLLNEDFFLYYEELDFARRIKDSPYKLEWCPQSIVFHKNALLTGSNPQNQLEQSNICHYHENLSTLIFTSKHHPKLLLVSASLRFLGKFLWFLICGRINKFPIVYQSYKDFFLIRNKRPQQKKHSLLHTKTVFLGSLK